MRSLLLVQKRKEYLLRSITPQYPHTTISTHHNIYTPQLQTHPRASNERMTFGVFHVSPKSWLCFAIMDPPAQCHGKQQAQLEQARIIGHCDQCMGHTIITVCMYGPYHHYSVHVWALPGCERPTLFAHSDVRFSCQSECV